MTAETTTDRATVTHVASADGTRIACFSSGDGPPLLLVHGTTADHVRWSTILDDLEPHATVHAIDRRGRGASGDGAAYALEREYEDVAAVVDHIAATSGQKVDVLGHSHGGFVAFGAARMSDNVRSLMLYEGWPAPHPEGMAVPPGVADRMETLVARGESEEALLLFMREVVEMRPDELAVYRTLPSWPRRVAAAHTVVRETSAVPSFDPAEAAEIEVPVLLLVGGDSPAAIQNDYQTVAAALPDAHVTVLEGQQHIAMDIVPEVFARHVLGFLRTRP